MADRINSTDSVNILTAIGGALSAGDRVFILDSDRDYSAGALTAAALALLLVRDDYTGNIGDAGVSINVDVTNGTGTLDYNGQGEFAYFAAVSQIDLLVVRPNTPGVVKVTAGTVVDWQASGGQNHLPAGVVVTNYVGVNCAAVIEDNATDLTSLMVGGEGTVVTDRGADSVWVGAGAVVKMENRSRDFATMDVAGTVIYRGGNVGGASCRLRPGGVLDLSRSGGDITFTNPIIADTDSKIILPRRGVTINPTITPVGDGPVIEYS